MKSVRDLFEEQGVSCPVWLDDESIDDERWAFKDYFFKKGVHTLEFENDLDMVLWVKFNGKEYSEGFYDKSGRMRIIYKTNGVLTINY